MKRTILVLSVFCGALMCWWVATGWTAIADNQTSGRSQGPKLIDSISGPALYKAYCASCHGMDGRGNGPMVKSLKVAPADLTHIAVRNGGVFPLARVSRIIAGEDLLPNGHGNSQMPVWGPIFSQVETDQDLGRVRIDNLARHLRDLQSAK
jgi:mono/diheme cytochrome c family protein